jgi:hypothetical protein
MPIKTASSLCQFYYVTNVIPRQAKFTAYTPRKYAYCIVCDHHLHLQDKTTCTAISMQICITLVHIEVFINYSMSFFLAAQNVHTIDIKQPIRKQFDWSCIEMQGFYFVWYCVSFFLSRNFLKSLL